MAAALGAGLALISDSKEYQSLFELHRKKRNLRCFRRNHFSFPLVK